MGVKLGADVEQIEEMLEPDQAKERLIHLFRFHEELSFFNRQVRYQSPKVLVIKNESVPSGVVIDEPEDIKTISLDLIAPMPPLIEACINPPVIWGVAIIDDDMVLLMDLNRLPACKKDMGN